MLRLLELTSLATFAGSNVTANVMSTPPDWVIQFGALGIVAFMVFQNYRQTRDMRALLGHKDDRLERHTLKLQELDKAHTAAMNRLAQCFEDRPCLAGDQRIKEPSEGG